MSILLPISLDRTIIGPNIFNYAISTTWFRKVPMGPVSPKDPPPNSPLGRELPPGGGGISQGDGTEEGPKGIDVLSPPFVLATSGVLAPASPALVGG